MNEIKNFSCVRNVITLTLVLKIEKESGVQTVSLEKLMVECTYVHVQYNLQTIILRQNMYPFMIVT